MIMIKRFIPAVAIVLAGAFAPVVRADEEAVTIPLLSRMCPIVRGEAGSGRAADFALDTGGAGGLLLSRKAATDWKLELKEWTGPGILDSGNRVTQPKSVLLEGFCLGGNGGGLRMDVEALVADLPKTLGLSGIVGVQVFKGRPLFFNVPEGKVRVLPAGDAGAWLAKNDPGRSWVSLPFEWRQNHPVVTLHAPDGQGIPLLFDTGANATILLRDRMDEAKGMKLGPWTVSTPISPTPSRNAIMTAAKVDGLLGFDVMGLIPFVFDGAGSRLWVASPPDGMEAVLKIPRADRARRHFEDPYPAIRIRAAESVARGKTKENASRVAKLLDDAEPAVREAAASALMGLAGEEWPVAAAERLAKARAWWEARRDDPAYARPAERPSGSAE